MRAGAKALGLLLVFFADRRAGFGEAACCSLLTGVRVPRLGAALC